MGSESIFISHATKDDGFVTELREALALERLSVWVDSRSLRGGDKLAPQIERAIEEARQVIVVLSPNTINSPWVRKEIEKALEVEQTRKDEGYRVVPLLLPGVTPAALELWFDEEPVGIPIQLKPAGLSEATPAILASLGERLPDDSQPLEDVEPWPVHDLVLRLQDAKAEVEHGKERVKATATLTYQPPTPAARPVESTRYSFTSPLGAIETDELRWYLESYYLWPVGVFQERAERTEKQLPKWGNDLYEAALSAKVAQEALNAWLHAADGAERRFSVLVDCEPPEGADEQEQKAVREAASSLLSLPWELLHDERSWLFQGKNSVRVRRRLPSRHKHKPAVTTLPIRILLVSPRPEDEHTAYIDHRVSARPLVDAVESLGELVELTVLSPATLPALRNAIEQAADRDEPFDVVHFDGHGVYDKKLGLGALCFEEPKDVGKLQKRASQAIYAEDIAGLMRDYRIPLVFLEACQSAMEVRPATSVAAKLLEEGVTSVVAMSHSVLVETARRFVEAFYLALAAGARLGQAMLAGQKALFDDTYRGKVMAAGELRLQDWFVPVLYQEEQDPQLFTALPEKALIQLQARQRKLSLGELPEPPEHQFQGRSRELLALERMLHAEPWAVVRGVGGSGKTTLAAELARWLVRTGRFDRAAFVSMEEYTDARTALDSLGRQLLPGETWSVAQFKTLKEALQPVEGALRDSRTIIVLDNLESVLPDPSRKTPAAAAPAGELFDLCQALLDADSCTRIVFTSRFHLPAPFDRRKCGIELGALSREDAVELVSRVMAEKSLTPAAHDPGSTPKEIADLVEAVNCHARALVLLAREVAHQGVRGATKDLHALMAELHERHPDDRENSLYASVELSLRRLSEEARKQVRVLGVFHGGVHMHVWDHVLEIDSDDTTTVPALCEALVAVGLAEDMGCGHLRLDPGLAPYLLGQMDDAERESLTARWAEGMRQLANFLYKQQFKDAELARLLTLLELPNLLALLDWVEDRAEPDEVVGLASGVEGLVADLGRPQALARAAEVRERAAHKLGEWSHAGFTAESGKIDRMWERGQLQAALDAAQQLVQRCLPAGEQAYAEAAYDIAIAHFRLGRAQRRTGAAEAALQPLADAQARFQQLADQGDADAAGMASVAIVDRADCLRDLGRLDDAAAAYGDGIQRAEKLDDNRQVAVNKGQLGTVRMLQRRYADALTAWTEAKDIFESLGEPGTVATAWHQIGLVHQEAGQLERAEQAYRQSLAIKVREKNRSGEANTLNQLGVVCRRMGRLEEAVTFYRQAADIHVELGDLKGEGMDRNNAANTLVKLGRYDEARREVLRAIECKKPLGHAAEPWKTWAVLHDLEQATGNPQAGLEARHKAVQAFLAYRRAGGENHLPGGQLCRTVGQAIQEGKTAEVGQLLAQLAAHSDAPPQLKALVPKLQAILNRDRDPALAADPELYCRHAVELQLLLEELG